MDSEEQKLFQAQRVAYGVTFPQVFTWLALPGLVLYLVAIGAFNITDGQTLTILVLTWCVGYLGVQMVKCSEIIGYAAVDKHRKCESIEGRWNHTNKHARRGLENTKNPDFTPEEITARIEHVLNILPPEKD